MSRAKQKAPKQEPGLKRFHVVCKSKSHDAVVLTTIALGKTVAGVKASVQKHIDDRPSLASSVYIASVVEAQ